MIKKFTLVSVLFIAVALTHCRQRDEYEVYAVKYSEGWKIQAKDWVLGANPDDSINVCNMFWLIKGQNGKNILVDAGFIDSLNRNKNYVRPDSVLQRISLFPEDITDIIITHPHNDHIGGINLFPKAIVWMQKDDYDYFIGPAWSEHGDSTGFKRNDVKNIIAINNQGRLRLVQGDSLEIMPGILVFTGSGHTFENQYLLVNSNSKENKIILASDAVWFYLNFEKMLPASICMDTVSYVSAMKRMKKMLPDSDLIIPGHDDEVFSKFTKVQDWIVRIGD
jgi:glyoxylase-like metal-dependent hydrolase (beta-lactamase superfamily II)